MHPIAEGQAERHHARILDQELDEDAARHAIRRLDLGGGLGSPYLDGTSPSPAAYAEMITALTDVLDCRIVLEPGRVIVGNAGILLARVIYVKEGEGRRPRLMGPLPMGNTISAS